MSAFDESFSNDFDIEVDGAGFDSGFDYGFQRIKRYVDNFTPTKMVWLERTGSLDVQHSHPSGRVGKWTRPQSDAEGEGHETLLVFDFSNFNRNWYYRFSELRGNKTKRRYHL